MRRRGGAEEGKSKVGGEEGNKMEGGEGERKDGERERR